MENEYIFLMFLSSLYAYKTEQADIALQQIRELLSKDILNNVVRFAILDLAVDILFFNGKIALFYKYYKELMVDSFSSLFPKASIKHQMQKIFLEMDKDNKTITYDSMNELRLYIIDNDYDYYNNLMLRINHYYKDYDEVIKYAKLINNKVYSSFIMAKLLLLLKDEHTYNEFNSIKEGISYSKHQNMYKIIIETIDNLFKHGDYYNCYTTMKSIIKNDHFMIGDFYTKGIIKEIYLNIAIVNGKYRDCVKQLLLK